MNQSFNTTKIPFIHSFFTAEEVGRLEQLTLSDVIMAVTRVDVGDLQENPFLVPIHLVFIQSFIY